MGDFNLHRSCEHYGIGMGECVDCRIARLTQERDELRQVVEQQQAVAAEYDANRRELLDRAKEAERRLEELSTCWHCGCEVLPPEERTRCEHCPRECDGCRQCSPSEQKAGSDG